MEKSRPARRNAMRTARPRPPARAAHPDLADLEGSRADLALGLDLLEAELERLERAGVGVHKLRNILASMVINVEVVAALGGKILRGRRARR